MVTTASLLPLAEAPSATAEPPTPSTEDTDDECVLCCYPLPLKPEESQYQACCGETICYGCIIAQRRTLTVGSNVQKPIAGSKEEDLEFISMLTSYNSLIPCPFCRAESPDDDVEILKRLYNQIDNYKDPEAMNMLAHDYLDGECGLTRNVKKAEELFKRSYDLGDPTAAQLLSSLYSEQIPDQARMIEYEEEGARRGNLHCMNCLAKRAGLSGNFEESARHLTIAACSGHDPAMQNLMHLYRKKMLSKEDLATALRAHKAVHDKRKNEAREYAIRDTAFDQGRQGKLRSDGDFSMLQYYHSRGHTSTEAERLFWMAHDKVMASNALLAGVISTSAPTPPQTQPPTL